MRSYLNKNYQNLEEIANNQKNKYLENKPFPHIEFQDFFCDELMNEIIKEFPSNLDILGIKHENEVEKKFALPVYDKLSESAKYLINQLNSFEFVNFLNKITGIKEALIPDPYLEGGGYHELKQNGFLNIHSDFNIHLKTKLDRRVNVLIYLNKDWEENFGGSLELWDKEMKKCEKKITPTFNKVVIFNTNDFSYHGNPKKISHPQKVSRKSIALYYYSYGRPNTDLKNDISHNTVFMKRPNTKDKASNQFKKLFGKFYYKSRS